MDNIIMTGVSEYCERYPVYLSIKTPNDCNKLEEPAIVIVAEMKSKSLVDEEFLENDKVKLNYENITSHPDYIKNKTSEESHVIRYHKFIEDNKDKIMTVQYDKNHQDHPQLVVLKEDENEDDCKWLFWVGDLIKIKEDL